MTISFNNGSGCSCNNSGIQSMVINAQGHLIVTYADSTIQDLGLVVGHDGKDGKNFYPNAIGFDVPDYQYENDKPLGWCYLSLANGTSTLYFKTSEADDPISTWNKVEFGKGDKGDAGKSFHIDASGTTFPTTGLFDGYTFYNTDDGNVYFYMQSKDAWSTGVPFRGERGPRGRFHIDSTGSDFPDISTLPEDYCFYNTTDGNLYYVDIVPGTNPPQKEWSTGINFRGKQGLKGDDGDKGDKGDPGKDTIVVMNTIDHSWTNAVLQVGTCPAGYLVTNIDVNVTQAYLDPVNEMHIRVGGDVQQDIGGTIIAPVDYFDINRVMRFIVNETNHEVSSTDEPIVCVFNESVNNSQYGEMKVIFTLSWQAPILPIQDNI